MSHVQATPQAMNDAAGNLSAVASTINTANSTAAPGTAGVKAPGGDEVSAYVTALFAAHAQNYQAASAQAAVYHDQFVQAMRAGAGSYANTEAANASPLQKVQDMVSPSSQNSAGHLIGNGPNGAAGTGQHGTAGGQSHGDGGTTGPGNGNPVGGGPGPVGGPGPASAPGGPPAGGHVAATGGPQGGNVGGGGGDGGHAADGGGSGAGGAVSGSGGGGGGATSGGGGGGGEAADPGGGGVGHDSGVGVRDAAGAGVPGAWGPAVPMAPIGPLLPGLTTPTGPALMAGDYPATAGLGGPVVGGDSPALSELAEPKAPAATPAAATPASAAPAAEPALATAAKEQSAHPGTPARAAEVAHPGGAAHQADAAHAAADTHHDKQLVPILLPSLRALRRKLQERSGLRDLRDWRKELSEVPPSKPWGRNELLSVLGLRPPGSE